jgi:hypothetical protein
MPDPIPEIVDLFHDSLDPKDVHAPYSFIFNNQLDRARSIVSHRDVGKFARQLDDGSIWVLWDTSPTWKRVLMEGTPTPPEGPAGGHLSEYYPSPKVVPDSHLHTPGISIPSYPSTLPPNGPAEGPDIEGIYPNQLSLKRTGIARGTYINPTITIDEKGRVFQATSGIIGEVNTAINMGVGLPLYKAKMGTILQFRSLKVEPSSGLAGNLGIDEVTLDSPGLAKLTGAEFSGALKAPTINVDNLSINKLLVRHLYQAGGGSNWIPEASNGSVQLREVIGSGLLGAISGAPVGMEFKFYINVGGNFQLRLDDEYLVPAGQSKVLTQGMSILEGYVITPYMYECSIRQGLH